MAILPPLNASEELVKKVRRTFQLSIALILALLCGWCVINVLLHRYELQVNGWAIGAFISGLLAMAVVSSIESIPDKP